MWIKYLVIHNIFAYALLAFNNYTNLVDKQIILIVIRLLIPNNLIIFLTIEYNIIL